MTFKRHRERRSRRLTAGDFSAVPGRMRIECPITPDLVDWWDRVFEGHGPLEVAEVLSRGMPGNVTARYSNVNALSETFSLDLSGSVGNASLWFNAATLDLKSAADGPGTLHEDDLGVDASFRGYGLAQIVVGNAVDVARSMGVTRVRMTAQDVGGYLWARAGALPRSWIEIMHPVLSSAGSLSRQSRIDARELDLIAKLVTAGAADPRMIRALSGLRRPVEGVDGLTRSLGARLLVGTNWRGEIDLNDLTTKTMFRRWRRCRKRSKARSMQRGSPAPETSPGRSP